MGYQSEQGVSNNHQVDIYNIMDVCYIPDGEKMLTIANVIPSCLLRLTFIVSSSHSSVGLRMQLGINRKNTVSFLSGNS